MLFSVFFDTPKQALVVFDDCTTTQTLIRLVGDPLSHMDVAVADQKKDLTETSTAYDYEGVYSTLSSYDHRYFTKQYRFQERTAGLMISIDCIESCRTTDIPSLETLTRTGTTGIAMDSWERSIS